MIVFFFEAAALAAAAALSAINLSAAAFSAIAFSAAAFSSAIFLSAATWAKDSGRARSSVRVGVAFVRWFVSQEISEAQRPYLRSFALPSLLPLKPVGQIQRSYPRPQHDLASWNLTPLNP